MAKKAGLGRGFAAFLGERRRSSLDSRPSGDGSERGAAAVSSICRSVRSVGIRDNRVARSSRGA